MDYCQCQENWKRVLSSQGVGVPEVDVRVGDTVQVPGYGFVDEVR